MTTQPYSERTLFGHPAGLTVLFLTETWEKFSYFGMRALLVYYMTKSLGFAQAQASTIYGIYTAVVYLTPIFGGLIADRWLGRRRAVILGGATMAAGHFMMAFPPLFYPALATIAVGNGLYLPSLPGQVSSLYAPGDSRLTRAYSLYYVGINLGAFMAPLICGTLGELYGWHWGFGAAGVGMLAGLCIYTYGQRYLPAAAGNPPSRAAVQTPWRPEDTRRFTLLMLIVAVVCVFRGAYEQIGNTIALWADTGVDRSLHFGGKEMAVPMTWFQSLNPILVFALTPLIVRAWSSQAARGTEAVTVRKMMTGALLVGAAYLLVSVSSVLAGGALVSGWVLAGFVFVLTWGELYILPVGLSLFGRLAPPRLAAFTISLWFSASFLGNLFAGYLGTLWSSLSAATFFALCAGVCALAAALLMPLRRPIAALEQRNVAV